MHTFFFFYFILRYNTVLVLPYIDMNPPRVYMRSQTASYSFLLCLTIFYLLTEAFNPFIFNIPTDIFWFKSTILLRAICFSYSILSSFFSSFFAFFFFLDCLFSTVLCFPKLVWKLYTLFLSF